MKNVPDPCHRVCYSREVLADFVLGKLPDDELEQIAREVENCPTCNAVLQTLDGLEDSVVGDLKQQLSSFSGQPSPELEQRLRRAESLSWEVWRIQAGQDAAGISERAPERDESLPKSFGQYRLLEQIGHGGMGTVYKAIHTRLKRPVAVKLLLTGRTRDPQAVARFQGEMEAVGRLDHPNLVRAHDAGEVEGQPFLAMEYLEGVDLARQVCSSGPLSVADACEAVRQAALGLLHAHEHGLIHRDVKPSNLMRTAGGVIKVLDLGLARLAVTELDGAAAEVDPASLDAPDRRTNSGTVTDTDQILGTGDYMAPEQWRDSHHVDARADIYALGCTLYFLLAGRAPFAGPKKDTFAKRMMARAREPVPDIRRSRPDVPDHVVAILHRMLAKSPQDRYQSATAVAEALDAAVAGENPATAAAQSTPGEQSGTRSLNRTRRAIPHWLLGTLILVTLGVGLFLLPYVGRLLSLSRNLPDQGEINSAIDGVQAETNQFANEVPKDLSAEQSERKRELEEMRRELPAH